MKKGYRYTVDDEKLLAFMALSTEDKFEWLEELNELTDQVLTPAEKEARAKLMAGEI